MSDGSGTYGALLIGAMIAAGFTGVLTSQCIAYAKFYPRDQPRFKLMVLLVWLLDASHIISVTVALWEYLIDASNGREADYIPKSLALSIAFTVGDHNSPRTLVGLETARSPSDSDARGVYNDRGHDQIPLILNVHGSIKGFIFFHYNQRSVPLTPPNLDSGHLLSVLPFLAYSMSLLPAYYVGYCMTATKILLDTLMLYTFENGALTCAIAVSSMICWLAMPTNLIFMGLHFIISKSKHALLNSSFDVLTTRSIRYIPGGYVRLQSNNFFG
ncbi:hypothetical protein VNI00_004448 [Paramarasmius palmivorus]|uniref:Uncharacterized protein n=1 Tax=Paramarasmius palmivorus TaxID=297713 RepID=A0AAW0DKD6_9AGAR